MTIEQKITDDFLFESKFIEVNGAKMHYIDEGKGDPIIFVHGIPASNYLWRNIIPYCTDDARCIAVDLIGCGKSDKPDIKYTIHDHIQYFTQFIEAMDLKNMTFFVHGWGSIIGLDYAMKNENQMKGLALVESHLRPTEDWDMVALPVQQIASSFGDKDQSYHSIINTNYFMDEIFPSGSLRHFTEKELDYYRKPFSTPESRQLIWQYLQEVPTGKKVTEATKIIREYSIKLQNSVIPKLLFYVVPGFITTMETVCFARDNFSHLTLVDIGEGLHYVQECNPHRIGEELMKWYRNLP